jgi:hypothetical protein
MANPLPHLSSIGLVDDYLAASFKANSIELAVSDPVFTVSTPYSPYLSFPVVTHAYTWNDELRINFSFPEGFMGTIEEQLAVQPTNEVTLIKWVDKFMHILEATTAPFE